MSLFGSIRMAANALQANQIGLQVVGQNIANANTPGYIREEVHFSPAPTQRQGNLMLGLGVEVKAVVQKIDRFLEERLRGSVSDMADAETQESSYTQLEGLIGELGDTDLSTSLTTFFNSINEVLNQPQDVSIRNFAVLQGRTLAENINRLSQRVTEVRGDFNDRMIYMADQINRLIEEVRTLNLQIVETEGGQTSASDAVGLRDQRLIALEELAKLINIRVREQPSGGVAVYTGSNFLVFEGVLREVEVELDSVNGLPVSTIRMAESNSPLEPSSGELHGLIVARDEIMDGFLADLDVFAGTLSYEFNKLYSSGQGLKGYDELTSEFAVSGENLALNSAGLRYSPVNGSFQVMVHNTKTGMTQTTDVIVDLNGIGNDTTLLDLANALNAIDGISANIEIGGNLTISSDSADQEFAFAADTSGTLAALGLNTFFSGTNAQSLGVNEVVQDDPATFAASQGGIAADSNNAELLAVMLDRAIESQNGESLMVLYDRMTGQNTQAASVSRAIAEGARVFEGTLRAQKMATSGVSLDEEAVKMIAYQRSFQASARYIAALDELFEIVVSL